MNASSNLMAAVMQLSDGDRFEFAMSLLDQVSPSAMGEEEILSEAMRRQDEMQCGSVKALSFDELVEGLVHRPRELT